MIKVNLILLMLISSLNLYAPSLKKLINSRKVPVVARKTLDLSSLNLTDISGIEEIDNIDEVQILILTDNKIKSLEPLLEVKNIELKFLDIVSNQVKDLSPISVFKKMKKLFVYGNNFDTDHALKVSRQFPKLEFLDVRDDVKKESEEIDDNEGDNCAHVEANDNQVAEAGENICSICTDESVRCDAHTHCAHAFHEVCLNAWVAIKNTCPMCRTVLN